MITGIACMQMVEQEKLPLDDAGQLYKILPELLDVKYLNDQGQLEDKQGDITLRMLLNHTAGFGYTFFNEKLRNYGRPIGFDEFAGDIADILKQPLVNQPGTRWEYGINIDWAGLAVERVSGMTLSDYFQQNIFEPLGVQNIRFFPNAEMKAELASMHQRNVDGSVIERDHLLRRCMVAATDHEKKHIFNNGGGGCFGKPIEYCQIIATLLNNGVSPRTNSKILEPSSIQIMFTNQIPHMPDFGRQHIPASKPDLTNPLDDVYPQEGNPPQGWGLTFQITTDGCGPGKGTGRRNGTVHWAGLANCFWWCDREAGVGGFIASQILPFGDPNVLGSWVGCEKAIYDAIDAQGGKL
jgi:CubicO group peptidase (beta-lactamase class C family)